MSQESTASASDLQVRLTAAFFSRVRSISDKREGFGLTPASAEQQRALCDRIEQLGPQDADLAVKLCCGGAEVDLLTAVETVEAIFRLPD